MKLLARLSRHRRDHPLGYRLLAYILAFSSAFTLLGTGLQLYWEYRTDVKGINDVLQQIEDSYLDSLTTSQWLLDEKLVRAQMNGILRLPEVHYVEIEPKEDAAAMQVGGPVPARHIRRTYPMVHVHRGQPVELGTLEVVATLDGVYERLREQVLVILGTQTVKTFATSLFILFVVQYLFTRHLHTLGEHAQRLSLNELDRSLTLNRSPNRRPDEMDHVVTAMEDMRRKLIDDLAALKVSEGERQQLITDLQAKNAEMESFTHTVSHDLRSPLVTVKGFCGFLDQDLDKGDVGRAKEDLARISSAAGTMHERVEDLLKLARAGRRVGTPEEVHLSELAHEAAELLSAQIGESGARLELSADLPVVWGDRSRLLVVFQNLIENSVKYMRDELDPRVEIGVRYEADEPVCFVRDNGIGIDPSQQEGIFGLFQQLDDNAQGSGVGLTLVHRIIAVHHGRIWVESEGHGRGCSFCFTLPRNRPRDASA